MDGRELWMFLRQHSLGLVGSTGQEMRPAQAPGQFMVVFRHREDVPELPGGVRRVGSLGVKCATLAVALEVIA